jgi:hypothetical protein
MDGNHDDSLMYCEKIVTLRSGKQRSHYVENYTTGQITMYALPYRIVTGLDNEGKSVSSKVGVQARYKTGKKLFYFKTLISCAPIHADTEDKLRNRIKTFLIFS